MVTQVNKIRPYGGVVGRASRAKQSRRRSASIRTPASSALLVPGYELALDVEGKQFPAVALPLLFTGAAFHQVASERPRYSAVLAAAQAARALQYLGVDAELMPSSAAINHRDQPNVSHELGVWRHEPVVRSDGRTDGHLIIWVESLRRCLDLDIGRHQAWQRSTGDHAVPHPMIFPTVCRRSDLRDAAHTSPVLSIPLAVVWWFFPSWQPIFEPLLARWHDPIQHGGLAAAHVILDMLASAAVCQDTSQMQQRFPKLGELLAGRAVLPAIDSDGGAGPSPAG